MATDSVAIFQRFWLPTVSDTEYSQQHILPSLLTALIQPAGNNVDLVKESFCLFKKNKKHSGLVCGIGGWCLCVWIEVFPALFLFISS